MTYLTGNKKIRPFIVLSTILIMALLAVGCAPAASQAGDAPENGNNGTAGGENILVVASTAEVTTWDPSSSFSTEVSYMANIYETLLRANPEGSDEAFTPLLAESWDISDDGLEWIFHIREDVYFHDGEKLTADAVKDSIDRTITLQEGASFIWSPVTSIDVQNEMSVKFTLSDPVPLDRIVSSGNGAWIMSPAAVTQEREWFEAGNAVGIGPYQLDSYRTGEEVVLTRFDDYWGGWNDNQYSRVIVKIVYEAVVQRQLLEAGDVQIASVVPVEALSVLENNPDINVYRGFSTYNYFGYLNTAKPPLDNVLVRQAVSYAVPYDDIIEIATGGQANQSQGPVPAGLWPWHESLSQYNYDIEAAKSLLREAGYPDGTLGGVDMVLTYASENPAHTRYAPLIQESLQQIGINLEVRPILWSQQWEMAKESDPETDAQDIFLLFWWPTYADGYDNLSSLFTESMYAYWNLSYWVNPHYDNLIDEAYRLSAVDPDTSQDLYIEAQEMLIEEAVALFFYDPQEIMTSRTSVKGNPLNPVYPRVMFFYDLYTD